MKRLFLYVAIFFLVAIFFVTALTETVKDLNVNKTATVNGKTLRVLRVSPSYDVLVDVDGVTGILPYKSKQAEVNGMTLDLLSIDYINYNYVDMAFKISVPYKCGDKFCNYSETSISCCKDCGCPNGSVCLDNVCRKSECNASEDCDDKNICTVDICGGTPKKCYSTSIISCADDDGCCPENCDFKSDSDCKQCEKDDDCAKSSPCVTIKCLNNSCIGNTTAGCALNSSCYKMGDIVKTDYCSEKMIWAKLKNEGAGCANGYECANKNCSGGFCGGKTMVDSKTSKAPFSLGNISGTVKVIALNVIIIAFLLFYYYHRSKKIETKL